MRYKLVAMDMDGTLLNSEKQITEYTQNIINKACKKGVKFAVVSGRSTPSLSRFEFLKNLGTPAIAYNGGKIVELNTGKVLFEKGLDADIAERLLKMGIERGSTICCWSMDKFYTDKLDDRSERYGRLSGMAPTLFDDCHALAQQGLTKMIWYDSAEKVQENIKYLDSLNIDSINYCTSDPRYLEIMNKEVSKAESLKKLGEFYGITPDEMIAVGDGENDLSMLSIAGLSVAMQNASDFVKEHCDYITDTNDNDGVAKMVEKFCL